MPGVLVIAGNDLKRRLRDRSVVIQGVLGPVVLAAIIGFAFGGQLNFHARIGLVDADRSDLSRGVLESIGADQPANSPIEFVRLDPDVVDDRIESGEVDAAVVFPEGFGSSIGGQQPLPLVVIVNAQRRIAGDIARSVADGIAARINGSRLAIAAALAAGPQPPDPARVEGVIEAGKGLIVPIDVQQEPVAGSYSPVAYFGPSMAMLFLFFTAGTGARSLISERREGILWRIRAGPVSDSALLIGKTVSVFVLGLLSLVVVWLITSLAFRAEWGDPLAVLAVITGVGFVVTGISMLITAVARTEAQADGLTSAIAFALALLGGNFIAPGGLPEPLEQLQLVTPNGWALRALVQIGAARATIGDIVPAVGVLLAVGLLTGGVALGVLRHKVVS